MPNKTNYSRTRVSSNTNKGGFKFRWWMGLGLVAVIAVVGVLVLRFSQASGGLRTPMHLAWTSNVNYAIPNGADSLEWDMKIDADPSPQGFFWSNGFNFVNGDGGYAGIQTLGNGQSSAAGKNFIFSIWNATGAEGPQKVFNYGHEGTGWSTSISYDWKVGRLYRFTLRREGIKNGAHVWALRVTDTTTNQSNLVGKIQVSGNWGGLQTYSGAFAEYYGGTLNSCADMPYTAAFFGNYKQNGQQFPFGDYPTSVTYPPETWEAGTECKDQTRYVPADKGVFLVTGTNLLARPDLKVPKSISSYVIKPASREFSEYGVNNPFIVDTKMTITQPGTTNNQCLISSAMKNSSTGKSCIVDSAKSLTISTPTLGTYTLASPRVRICFFATGNLNFSIKTSHSTKPHASTEYAVTNSFPDNPLPNGYACANSRGPILSQANGFDTITVSAPNNINLSSIIVESY